LTLPHDASEAIFYATAIVAQGIELVTIIGPLVVLHDSITINELTTVAAAFSMAQFSENGKIGGAAFGLRIASLLASLMYAYSRAPN